MSRHVIVLDDRELATVLGALRNWQRGGMGQGAKALADSRHLIQTDQATQEASPLYIASKGFKLDPLTDDDIDPLCDRIKTEDWWIGILRDEEEGCAACHVGTSEQEVERKFLDFAAERLDSDEIGDQELIAKLRSDDHETAMEAFYGDFGELCDYHVNTFRLKDEFNRR